MCGSGIWIQIQEAPEYGSNMDPDPQHCCEVIKLIGTVDLSRVEDPRAGRAFLDLRSRVPGVLGTRARGNAECEEVGTLISRA